MSEPTLVHDSRTYAFIDVCRHCFKTEGQHIVGQCSFDSTSWSPMDYNEWLVWRLSKDYKDLEANNRYFGKFFTIEPISAPQGLPLLDWSKV